MLTSHIDQRAADLNRYVSIVARLVILGFISIFALPVTFVFAETSALLNLPKTEYGLREKIGGKDIYNECIEQNRVRSCWLFSEVLSSYKEEAAYSGWKVKCTFIVNAIESQRKCWMGGKGFFVRLSWEGSELNYEASAFASKSKHLNSYAPVHVTIDNKRFVSPEDAPYAKLALEKENGDKVTSTEFVDLVEKAKKITIVTWDEDDQERTVTDRGVGFSKAHEFAIGFLDRTL